MKLGGRHRAGEGDVGDLSQLGQLRPMAGDVRGGRLGHEGQALKFSFRPTSGAFVDSQTGSRWDITGRAVSGPLAGKRLERIPHGDFFAFAWLAFRPKAQLYGLGEGDNGKR